MALRYCLTLTLLMLFLACPARAQTADPIGTIIETEGAASINHAGQTKAAAADMDVYMNDVIETGTAGRVLVMFIDDTQVTLSDNAQLKVDDYVFDADAASGNKGRFSILRGAFLFASGLMTKVQEPDVAIETAYGSIGLRGTTVWGGEMDGQYGVFVKEGEVVISNNRARTKIAAGQGTNIRNRDSLPELPKTWSPDKIGKATGTIALKRADVVRRRIADRRQKHQDIREQRRTKRTGAIDQRDIPSAARPRRPAITDMPAMTTPKDNAHKPQTPANRLDKGDLSAPAQEQREKRYIPQRSGGKDRPSRPSGKRH